MAEVTDFFDEMKSRSKGYASMEYQFMEYREDDLIKLDVKINGEIAEPLACICHRCAPSFTQARLPALQNSLPCIHF
jgi:translation elongation factor EF-4